MTSWGWPNLHRQSLLRISGRHAQLTQCRGGILPFLPVPQGRGENPVRLRTEGTDCRARPSSPALTPSLILSGLASPYSMYPVPVSLTTTDMQFAILSQLIHPQKDRFSHSTICSTLIPWLRRAWLQIVPLNILGRNRAKALFISCRAMNLDGVNNSASIYVVRDIDKPTNMVGMGCTLVWTHPSSNPCNSVRTQEATSTSQRSVLPAVTFIRANRPPLGKTWLLI